MNQLAPQNAWANLLSDNQAAPFYWSIALLGAAAVSVIVAFGAAQLARGDAVTLTGGRLTKT